MSARKIIRWLGLMLVGAGVILVAWGLVTWRWGDPVTGMYTHWQQRKLEAQYEQLVTSVKAETPPAPAPTISRAERRRLLRAEAVRFRTHAPPGSAIGRIHIAKLGLDMVLLNGTDSGTLKKGPGRDERTFMPGEGQLVYIAGHRTTYGAPFAHIDRLHTGDPVVIEMPYGRFRYRVTRSVIVPATDLARLKTQGHEEIALQACHPRFSARERYIVYAVPQATTRMSAGTSSSTK